MGRSGSSADGYPDAAYEPPLFPDEWDSETSDALIQSPPLPLFQQTPIPAAAGESSLPASWPNISAGLAPPVQSAQQEEEEWKRKYETQIALEKAAAAVQESREAELSSALAEKENKIKDQATKIEQAEQRLTALNFELKAAESKIKNHNLEKSTLKLEIKELAEKVDSANVTALSAESKARILEQEKIQIEQEKMHLEQKYQAQLQNFNEVQERCKTAEREAKKAMELADKARAGAASAQKEKSDFEHVAAERFTQIERAKRHAETLEKQTADLANEVKRYKAAEGDALSKVEMLEGIVREKDKKIDSLLQSNNSRRKNSDQISESLLESGHAALSEANNRAEGLRAQLQIVQGKFDELTKELTANRFSEKRTVESKLGTASVSMHGRADDDEIGVDSIDGGSVLGVDEHTNSQQTNQEDYTKFTIDRLKRELTNHNLGTELSQLKGRKKKDLVALYERCVLKKQV